MALYAQHFCQTGGKRLEMYCVFSDYGEALNS